MRFDIHNSDFMKCFHGMCLKSVSCVATVGLLFNAGCASYVYQSAFKDYGVVYAEGQNYQMLLNLARLSQHHPTYFFQSGNIQANYTLTGQLTAQGGQVAEGGASHVPFGWIVNGLGFQGTRTSQPTFNFVPLVGGDFAAHLVVPVNPEMFNAFFQSGFPVDILMRCLVQQVQFSIGTNGDEEILNNTPTSENINYARFLRLCDMLRDLQQQGFLLLEQRESDTNAEDSTSAMPGEITNAPMAKDIIDGLTNGYNWKKSTNATWHLERAKTNGFKFLITRSGIDYLKKKQQEGKLPYNHPEQVAKLLFVLNPEVSNKVKSHVVLRSFLFVLQDMATEQEAFKMLMNLPGFSTNEVPARQLRPVLRTQWDGETNVFTPLVKVNYRTNAYEITDPVKPYGDYTDYTSYNRDAFSLACTLFTQISLDPAKLNYQSGYLLVR